MIRLAQSLRTLAQRFALFLFAGLALALMLLNWADNAALNSLRAQSLDYLVPVMEVLSRPVTAVQDGIDSVNSVVNVYRENRELRQENLQLLQWESAARQLAAENRAFRDLLNSTADIGPRYVTARVVGMSSGTFKRAALVSSGRNDGVEPGQAVATSSGLFGRVVNAGSNSAMILLLGDLNSRIPVRFESSRVPAIVAGDNTDVLKLSYVANGADVRVGARLVTSGEGGMIPPGIPVGYVSASRNGEWRVVPWVEPERIEFVLILDYALPGILQETRDAGRVSDRSR